MTSRHAASEMFADIHKAKELAATDPPQYAAVALKHGLTRP